MKNRTGAFVAAQRHAHQLTPAQLAVRAGYTNTSKGARRIVALERYGVVVDGLLDRLIDALDLDRVYFLTLVEDDRRAYEEAWERWADEPVAPELRFRALPAVWFRTSLPADISQPDAVTYAKDRAATTRLTHVLAWSRREHVWIYPDGHVGVETFGPHGVQTPCSKVVGQSVVFG